MLEHLIDRVQRDSVVAASGGRQVERQLDLPVLSGKADAVVRDHKLQRPVFGAADGHPGQDGHSGTEVPVKSL